MTKSVQKLSKTQEENWKDLWHQPCPVRGWTNQKNGHEKEFKTVYDCSGTPRIYEATSGNFAVQISWRSHCRKRIYFDDTLQFGAKVYSDATSDEDSGCKSYRLETIPAWNLERVKSKKKVTLEAQREKKKVHIASLMDRCHLKKRGVRAEATDVQRQSRARAGHCQKRLWNLCSFYWTGLVCVPDDCWKDHGCYCKITWLWWTSSWCSICLHPGKNGGRSDIVENSKSECPDIWIRLPRHKWSKSWNILKIPWYLLNETCTAMHWPDCYGRDNSKKLSWSLDGRKIRIGNVCSFIGNKAYFCQFL